MDFNTIPFFPFFFQQYDYNPTQKVDNNNKRQPQTVKEYKMF